METTEARADRGAAAVDSRLPRKATVPGARQRARTIFAATVRIVMDPSLEVHPKLRFTKRQGVGP